MAFVVKYFDYSDVVVRGGGGTWSLEDKKPKIPADCEVEEFQADGRELDYIRLRFRNLPVTTGDACTWRGDLAAFVYDNL